MSRTPMRPLALALVGSLAAGCSAPVADSLTPSDDAHLARKPGEPGSAADRQLYQVRLGAINDTRSHGVILLEVVGGDLAVTVHAAGLLPDERVPQHIHQMPTCAQPGPPLLNLDDALTFTWERPPVNEFFPTSNRAGVVNYYATRSLAGMRASVNQQLGLGLSSDAELLDWLNLEERNAHMHILAPPNTPRNCGEVERLN